MVADVENTTVITAGMDATDYVTAAGQMVDANAALAASGEAVVAAGDTVTISQTKTTRAIIDGGAAYDRLKRSLDPAYASAQQYAKATDTITAAVNLHGVSQTEANAMMALAATRYNSASLAGDKFTLSSRQTEFIMHEMALTSAGAFAALAAGAPIMSVVALEGTKLATAMVLSRRGFAIVTENWNAMIGMMGGGWAAAGIAGLVALTAGLVIAGVSAENAADKLKTLQNQLGATRTDAVAAAAQVTAVAKMVAATTGITTADARGAATEIAGSKDWEGSNAQMQALILVADNLALRLGTTLPEAAKKWIVAGFDDPAKAAQTLVDKLTGFDGILVEHLKELEKSGQLSQAWAEYLALLSKASAGANTNITQLQTAIKTLDAVWTGAGQGGKNYLNSIGTWFNSLVSNFINGFAVLSAAVTGNRIPVPGHPDQSVSAGDVFFGRAPAGASGTGQRGTFSISASGAADVIDQISATLGLTKALDDFATRIAAVESGGRQFGGPHQSLTRSPTNALGMMQVEPDSYFTPGASDTSRTIDGAAYDLTTQVGNVTAGLKLLQQAFTAYGGDLSKVAVAYNGGMGALDRDSLKTETMQYLNKLNLPEPAHGSFPGGGVPTAAGGHTALDAAAVAAAAAAAAGTSAVAGAAVGAVDKAGAAGGGGFAPKSMDDASAAAIQSAGLLSTRIQQNADAQAAAIARIADAENKLHEAQTAATPDDAAISRYTGLLAGQHQVLDSLRVAALSLTTEQQKMAKASTDALVPLQAESGAARVLAEAANAYRLAAEKDPNGADAQAAAIGLANAQALLTSRFNDNVKAMTDSTASAERLIQSREMGTAASERAANAEHALTEAKATSVPGTDEYTRQVTVLTAALNAQSMVKRDAAAASMVGPLKDEIAMMNTEIGLVGASADARNREIAVMQERQKLGLQIGEQAGPEQQKIIDMTAALADQKTVLGNLQTSLNSVASTFGSAMDSVGSSLAQSLIPAKGQVVDWGNTMTQVAQQVLEAFLKLAVIQPLLNSMFGQSGPTLGGAMSAMQLGTSSVSTSGSLSGFLGTIAGWFGYGGSAAAVAERPWRAAWIPLCRLIYHAGGIVGSGDAPTRYVHPAYFDNAPRYHGGLSSDEFATILQRGEQVLTARQSAATANVVRGLSAQPDTRLQPPPPITVHVHGATNPDTFRASAAQVMRQAYGAQQRAAGR